jgi:hypothetical protein
MRLCEVWGVCVALLYCLTVVIQSPLHDAGHTLNCSTPSLFYRRLRNALIWNPVSYLFTFPSHSGFFLFLVSWCFHFHLPPCSQLKFAHAWAQYCDLELLAPVKNTKFCSLDAVEYRELLAKCFRRRCVELSSHGPVLALLGYTPLPQVFLDSQQSRRKVCVRKMTFEWLHYRGCALPLRHSFSIRQKCLIISFSHNQK